MGKKAFIGVSSKAHQVKKMYLGVGDKAHKVKKGYLGVGGKAHQFFASEHSLWAFASYYLNSSSATITIPPTMLKLDDKTGVVEAQQTIAVTHPGSNSTFTWGCLQNYFFWQGPVNNPNALYYDYETCVQIGTVPVQNELIAAGSIGNYYIGCGNKQGFYNRIYLCDSVTGAATSFVSSSNTTIKRTSYGTGGNDSYVFTLSYGSLVYITRWDRSTGVSLGIVFGPWNSYDNLAASIDINNGKPYGFWNMITDNSNYYRYKIVTLDPSTYAVSATLWEASENTLGSDIRGRIWQIGGRFK